MSKLLVLSLEATRTNALTIVSASSAWMTQCCAQSIAVVIAGLSSVIVYTVMN